MTACISAEGLLRESFLSGDRRRSLSFATETERVSQGNERDFDPLERRAIEATRAGERGSYDYLVEKYMRRVVSIAWGVVRNTQDAEDLAQEAFVKAFQSIGRFKEGEPFGPWIYRIVTNLSLDLLKHRKRFPQEELPESARATRRDEADLPAMTCELAIRIDRAIESLPEMQRVVSRLHLVEQFEYSEIAAMMGLSEGTIRSHLSLARAKLRDHLADLHEDSHE